MEVVAAQGTGRKFAVELIGTFFLVFTVGEGGGTEVALVARRDAARQRRVLPAAAVSLFDGGTERREAVFPRCWYTCYGC
jgi:hypothetical protein